MAELLEFKNVVAGYGRGPDIMNGATLTVRKGRSHCIIGPNGAGKSTLLKVISGLLPVRQGEVLFKGERIDGLRPDQVLRKGICYVTQERAVFPKMTVRENLRMGGYILQDKKDLEDRIEAVLVQFPILREKAHQHAGTLSGGQQQQLAIGRALLTKPKLLILDEPTEGIQPSIIKDIEHVIQALANRGDMAILLVEQYYDFARLLADQYIVMQRGAILKSGRGADMDKDNVRALLSV